MDIFDFGCALRPDRPRSSVGGLRASSSHAISARTAPLGCALTDFAGSHKVYVKLAELNLNITHRRQAPNKLGENIWWYVAGNFIKKLESEKYKSQRKREYHAFHPRPSQPAHTKVEFAAFEKNRLNHVIYSWKRRKKKEKKEKKEWRETYLLVE